jgi:hypothetical protein
MRRARREAADARAGRHPDRSAGGMPAPDVSAPVYRSLHAELDRLRSLLAAADDSARPIADVRGDHADLDRSLAAAVAQAFAADARGAPVPPGCGSWVAEGLALSLERELALFAATDVGGIRQPLLALSPAWWSVAGAGPEAL